MVDALSGVSQTQSVRSSITEINKRAEEARIQSQGKSAPSPQDKVTISREALELQAAEAQEQAKLARQELEARREETLSGTNKERLRLFS